ncbi:choice-of-anchor L domain-containing protein [Cryomorphaceae bacterium 1068]|nr:choice-of-anchor L domain-containing protein [Cryomorphaceae bacterium 1068]
METTRSSIKPIGLLFAFILSFAVLPAGAQIEMDNTMTVEELVQNVLLGNGVSVTNITFNGQPADQINVQAARFSGNSALVEFPEALVLATTNASNLVTGDFTGDPIAVELENDPDLVQISGFNINDAAVLEFDFVPNGDSLEFRYVFASTEYQSFTCSSFNDAFGFFLSGPGLNGPFTDDAINIALIPNSDIPVGVNTVNGGVPTGGGQAENCESLNPNWVEDSQYFVENYDMIPDDIQINGMTVTLTAYAEVQCGEEYHIKLAIGDASDGALDSGVFLEAGSFTSNSAVDVSLDIPVGVNDSTLYEGCGEAYLQFIRPVASSGIQEVAYLEISGTATNGVDFLPELPDSIVFPLGVDTVFITMSAPFDGLSEGEETVIVTITNVASECSGAVLTSNFQFYIREPDPMEISGFDGALQDCSDEIELFPTVTGGYGEYGYIWSNGMSADTITVSPGFTTTYFLTVTDTCGVDPLSTEFNVDVPVYPPVFVDLGDDVFIETCDVVLPLTPETTSGGFGAYNYQWFVDGEFVTDANPFNYLVEATSTVAVIASDVCGDTDSDTIFVELPPSDVTAFVPQGYVAETCLEGFLLPVIADGGIGGLRFTWTVDGDTLVDSSPLSYFDYHPSMGQTVAVHAEDQCQNFAKDTTIVEFDYPKVSFELSPDTSICPETDAVLRAVAVGGSGNFKYVWEGYPDSTGMSLTVEPDSDRNYFMSVSDTCGMRADSIISVDIRNVRADFDHTEIEYYGMQFENYSIGEGLTYLWDFGDGNRSDEIDPRHFFSGLDSYTVILTATDIQGCQDTAYLVTDPPTEIFIPTAFSPNGDGINDLFGVYGENITEFDMWIFDRWGEEVFYSNDPDVKWNGSNRNGEFYPGSTTFNYLIEYKGESEDDATKITGLVHLVR